MVKVEEPSIEAAVHMLSGLKVTYEQHHAVHVTDEAIEAAVTLSDRYSTGRYLPDKAIDLIDTASARVNMGQSLEPQHLEGLKARILYLEDRLARLNDESKRGLEPEADVLQRLREELTTTLDQAREAEQDWRSQREVGLADESQYCLTLSDLPDDTFLVETVDLREWTFHQDFAIELKVLLRHGMPPDPLLNQPATFSILSGGASLPLHGVITACENADGNGDYDGLKLTLSSVLWLLKPTRHNRVFVDRSAVDIAKSVLADQ